MMSNWLFQVELKKLVTYTQEEGSKHFWWHVKKYLEGGGG